MNSTDDDDNTSRTLAPSMLSVLQENQANVTAPTPPFTNRNSATTLKPVIVIYPTIAPETVIIPILSSIVIFPIVAATVICMLRHYNRRARAKDQFRSAYRQGASAIFSLTKIGTSRTVGSDPSRTDSARKSVPPSRPFLCMPELELDTVMEDRDEYDDEGEEEEEEEEEDEVEEGRAIRMKKIANQKNGNPVSSTVPVVKVESTRKKSFKSASIVIEATSHLEGDSTTITANPMSELPAPLSVEENSEAIIPINDTGQTTGSFPDDIDYLRLYTLHQKVS